MEKKSRRKDKLSKANSSEQSNHLKGSSNTSLKSIPMDNKTENMFKDVQTLESDKKAKNDSKSIDNSKNITKQDNQDNKSSITDRDYQHEGHQYSGEIEGFGNRTEQQHGQDWIEQDEYREGHSQTKRGHGKYGSR